jgi:hypothetical protein
MSGAVRCAAASATSRSATRLDLEFANVPEATVNTICDHYNGQGGGTLGFTVPAEVFAGYSSTLQGKVRTPAGIEWLVRSSPPSIKSELRDLSSISVKLVGEIR